MNSGKLAGKVAWVSGAASGMGEAVAMLFAAEGARIALIDRDAEKGRAVAQRILQAGGAAEFFLTDVASEDQVARSMSQTVSAFGGLQIIVNCAGIVLVKELHEMTEAEWDATMAVNVKSIFFSLKHGLPHLRRHNRSYMVNIGSVGTFVGQPRTPAYTTSKGAVLQLSRSIAVDYAADGLRCNCICPGITDTPMLRFHMGTSGDAEAALKQRLRRVPTGVALMPGDIAKSVLYFSCDDSAGITGTSLIVDGGYLAAAEWTSPAHTAFMEKPV
jgi:NAD(P)-dependent dehydrogenase (short-subunit alcohol dehydrogenase family)